MALSGRNRRILLFGNPILRRRAAKVSGPSSELEQILADLKATMLQQDGLGLAANQIGEALAAIAINPRGASVDMDPCCLVNPEVFQADGLLEAEEGCLSLPGLYEIVARPERVRIRALDEHGQPFELEARGLLARALVHEIDHINGVLFIDHISPVRRRMLAARLREIEEREQRECG
ncbi:MAG: peptide deformylase [candidate division WOR-3 bacterium]